MSAWNRCDLSKVRESLDRAFVWMWVLVLLVWIYSEIIR